MTTSPDSDPPQPAPPIDTTVGRAPEPPVAEPTTPEPRPTLEPRTALQPGTTAEPPTEFPAYPADFAVDEATKLIARPASPIEQQVTFVPLAVSVGDGFKFGCGFFLALVLAMLIGFVLLAALFVLTSLFGLNLPISR